MGRNKSLWFSDSETDLGRTTCLQMRLFEVVFDETEKEEIAQQVEQLIRIFDSYQDANTMIKDAAELQRQVSTMQKKLTF